MANINIGFHATPEEICEFVNQAIMEYDLVVIAAKIFPEFEYKIIDKSIFRDNISYLLSSRFIILATEDGRELSDKYNEFLIQNIDSLIIQLGESTDKFMIESSIGTRCQDLQKLKIWKSIIKQFKKHMHQGVWAINPYTKARGECKSNYYSNGAMSAYTSGVTMKATAGWIEYQFVE